MNNFAADQVKAQNRPGIGLVSKYTQAHLNGEVWATSSCSCAELSLHQSGCSCLFQLCHKSVILLPSGGFCSNSAAGSLSTFGCLKPTFCPEPEATVQLRLFHLTSTNGQLDSQKVPKGPNGRDIGRSTLVHCSHALEAQPQLVQFSSVQQCATGSWDIRPTKVDWAAAWEEKSLLFTRPCCCPCSPQLQQHNCGTARSGYDS